MSEAYYKTLSIYTELMQRIGTVQFWKCRKVHAFVPRIMICIDSYCMAKMNGLLLRLGKRYRYRTECRLTGLDIEYSRDIDTREQGTKGKQRHGLEANGRKHTTLCSIAGTGKSGGDYYAFVSSAQVNH